MLNDHRLAMLARQMDVSVLRAQIHAGNIANQNTPGYHAKAVAFDEAFEQALAGDGDPGAVEPAIFEPRDTPMQPDGNDVAVGREIMQQAENQTLYNAYIAMARGRIRLLTIAAGQAPGG
jgi:flagellar basal-body rod protein FlgB